MLLVVMVLEELLVIVSPTWVMPPYDFECKDRAVKIEVVWGRGYAPSCD